MVVVMMVMMMVLEVVEVLIVMFTYLRVLSLLSCSEMYLAAAQPLAVALSYLILMFQASVHFTCKHFTSYHHIISQ